MLTVKSREANTVGVDIVDPATGRGIETGEVAIYLIQRRGDDAGDYWDGVAEEWSESPASCGSATHESAGHWTIEIAAAAWVAGDTYRLYGVLDGGSYVSHSIDVLAGAPLSGETMIDGMPVESLLECLLAFMAGRATVVAGEHGEKIVTYYKRDDTTAKLVVTAQAPYGGRDAGGVIDP